MEDSKKQNAIGKKLYIALFMLVILTPFVGMLFYKTDMTAENRTATPFPTIKTYDGKINRKYFDQFNDFFNDHFALRQEMTTVDALMTTKLLNTSKNDDVIYGKDGWLYYEDTMDEYFGRNVLSDRGINNCVKSLSLMQEYCEKNDVEFLFMVAPIKGYLYPEHMPYNYIQTGNINNWDKLKPAMDAKGIKYVDLHKAFKEDDRVMYHKLDTHWNNEGAAFACKKIQEAAGREATDYTNESYKVENVFRGDLYRMLYPKGKKLDENVIYDREFGFDYISDFNNTEDFKIEATCDGKDGNLLMFRDSYGNALVPYMADEYGHSLFTKTMPFDLNYISEYNADIMMVELTQRHITYLWEYLPVMNAPLREDVPSDPEVKEMNADMKLEVKGDQAVIYGNVDPAFTDDDSEVYVRIYDSQYVSDYEAFPVGYNSAAEKDNKDYRFGMYLDMAEIADGESTFEVITKKDGVYYSSGTIFTYTK
ncbi:MAG: hypothetical protein K6F55_00890 [Eubacterium sp.]|nr:hypothetical protein [Eubacterium sp.]